MTKSAHFNFATATASEIVSAIDSKKTTTINLHTFRTRAGGAAKADKIYPHTRDALNILKRLRQQARNSRPFKTILKPLSNQFAAGATLVECLKPVLEGYRQMYLDKLGLALTHEQIIMLLVATDGVEQLQKYGYSVIGEFPAAPTA